MYWTIPSSHDYGSAREMNDPEALLSASEVCGMGAAMVAELAHPAAVAHLRDLADEVLLYLDAGHVLVLPRAHREDCERALTDAVALEADRSVKQDTRSAARPLVYPLRLPDAAPGRLPGRTRPRSVDSDAAVLWTRLSWYQFPVAV